MNSMATSRAQIISTFTELFGEGHDVQVNGAPVILRDGILVEEYVSQVVVDGDVVAEAFASNWRQSHRLLKFQVEKLYIDGHALV